MGYYDTPGYASSVYVLNNILFVADKKGGLIVVKVTIDSKSNNVGKYATSYILTHIYVSGKEVL